MRTLHFHNNAYEEARPQIVEIEKLLSGLINRLGGWETFHLSLLTPYWSNRIRMRIAPSEDRWGVMESWIDGMAGRHAKPELRERARCLLLDTGYEIT